MKPQRRCRGERGQAAGIETIPFGILVFVSVTLLMVNAWGIITNQGVADSIAREYLRAYTSADNQPDALRAGRQVARLVADDRGLPPSRVHITDATAWGPCAVAQVTVTVDEPEIRAPFLGGFGTSELTVTHRDRIDAYRVGVSGAGRGANC
jgi:hypothetical protein